MKQLVVLVLLVVGTSAQLFNGGAGTRVSTGGRRFFGTSRRPFIVSNTRGNFFSNSANDGNFDFSDDQDDQVDGDDAIIVDNANQFQFSDGGDFADNQNGQFFSDDSDGSVFVVNSDSQSDQGNSGGSVVVLNGNRRPSQGNNRVFQGNSARVFQGNVDIIDDIGSQNIQRSRPIILRTSVIPTNTIQTVQSFTPTFVRQSTPANSGNAVLVVRQRNQPSRVNSGNPVIVVNSSGRQSSSQPSRLFTATRNRPVNIQRQRPSRPQPQPHPQPLPHPQYKFPSHSRNHPDFPVAPPPPVAVPVPVPVPTYQPAAALPPPAAPYGLSPDDLYSSYLGYGSGYLG